jgi:hypothetical protein
LALGLLALCKAAFLYIGLGFVVLLLLTRRSNRAHSAAAKPGWKNVLLTYGLILAAMALTIAPWIARNAVELGKPQIVSGTDASVLGTRMLLTEHSLLGQLYLYTPPTLKPGVGWLTGYTSKDLEPGGRLEAASKAKDERVAIFTQRMQAEQYLGARGPWLKDKALDYVVENPARYLASIPLFAYKGLWFLSGAGAVINLLAVLTFLCIFFAAVLARDRVLLAAFGLAAGLYFFIAIFTHALLRYNAPMTPFVVLSCLWLVGAGAHWANRRFDLERMLQRRSDAKSSTHRSPTTPTSSAETASRA